MAKVSLQTLVRNIISKSKSNNIKYRILSLEKLSNVFGIPKVERVMTRQDWLRALGREGYLKKLNNGFPFPETIPGNSYISAHEGVVFTHNRIRAKKHEWDNPRQEEYPLVGCNKLNIRIVNSSTIDIKLTYGDINQYYAFEPVPMVTATFRLTYTGPHRPNFDKSRYGANPMTPESMWRFAVDNKNYEFDPGYQEY